MAPSALFYDVWAHNGDDPIIIDVLLPNGLLIQHETDRQATLLEIKEDVWEAAQHYPLYGALHDMQTYVFICVNQTTAEKEELVDEQRRLCDVRPFQAMLKLVERKGDKAEKILDTHIGFLIGKGLHEFDALKNPEINDFRGKMRIFCEGIARERERKSWLEKVLYQFPIHVEKEHFPDFLTAKLKDNNLTIIIKLENTNAESSFKFTVPYDIIPRDLLKLVLNKKAHTMGLEESQVDSYVFKICGQQEYLLGSYPLGQYTYVQQMIAADKIPQLIIVTTSTIQLDTDNIYETLEEMEMKRTRSVYGTVGRKSKETISSWTIEEYFTFNVNSACKLNCEDYTRVALQAGLFHGGQPLCEIQSTSDIAVYDGKCAWEDDITFDLKVCDIPRMARLCLVIYEVNKTVKGNKTRRCRGDMYPLVWVNTTVYDFKNTLKTGSVTLHMWIFSQEPQAEDMFNPLGSVVSNPNMESSTVLTITFSKYNKDCSITYTSFDKILECAAQHITHENGQECTPHASKPYLEQLRQICERDPLHQMHEQEKQLMWYLKEDCRFCVPHSLPKLLQCLKWNDHNEVAQMTALLQVWPLLTPEKALELLDYAYADQTVRSFAVKCLKDMSNEDLSLYLLQLVQALKHESYLHCDLVEFLLKRALTNQHIGHRLFWLLRSEMRNASDSVRFGLILEAYCRGAVEHMKSLSKQVEALNKLTTVSEHIQSEANKKKEGRDKLKSMMQELLEQKYYKDSFTGLHNPLNPCHHFNMIRVQKCKFMDSKMKPLWLVFENEDGHGQDIFIIFKNGDDLRQDMLTLQMIRIMDKLWKNEGMDFRMTPYHCIATDFKVGLIEVVLQADTIANIQKEKSSTATSAFKRGSLLAWLKDHNPDETGLAKAIDEFTLSCAGYCVATYVLGIADRHSDNIMVKTNGQLFHVDFGHILGRFKEKFGIKRERVPFVLANDFVFVITSGHDEKSQAFKSFQQKCEDAFIILRRNGSLIISLFAMMLSTGIPELTCEKDLDYLRETLVLDLTETEALKHFRSKFNEALKNSWKVHVNWLAHNWAKDNKMSS